MSKAESCFVLCIGLVVIFICVAIVMIPSIILSHYISLEDVNDATVDNWNAEFINDIVLIPKKQACPLNYEEFLTYKWPGTSEGCYCKIY